MRRVLIFSVVLVAVGYACLWLGARGSRSVERLLVDRATDGLAAIGLDWAEMRADGLHLEIHGHAPDLFAHDLALETARATAPFATVVDHMSVSLAPPLTREPLRVELLRDGEGVTLTGRFAGTPMRGRLLASLAAAAPGIAIHDLTGVNAERPGAGWGPELDVAVRAAVLVENAYVTIEPGAVRVEGLAGNSDDREAIGKELMELAGGSVRLTLALHEPLRVAAPFLFAVHKDLSGALRLELCAARDAEEEAAIEATLTRYQVAGPARRCPAALGGPAGGWAAAIASGLEALDRLPAGRFRLEYRTAELTGEAPTGAAELEPALAALAASLPQGYALIGALPGGAAEAADAAIPERHWMHIGRLPEGVVLSGTVADAAAERVLLTYAKARFGADSVHMALTHASGREPAGWGVAAMVALDTLAGLSRGEADVVPGRIAVRGMAAAPAQAARLHRLLAGEAPAGYKVTTALTVDLPARVEAVPLTVPRCVSLLSAAVLESPIEFDPGSAVIEGRSRRTLDRLARIFRRCDDGVIEIGGHTDSQGSDELNLRLSAARANAVLDGLLQLGVPLARMTAQGYGDTEPVADNATEAGRALNRRIAFVARE